MIYFSIHLPDDDIPQAGHRLCYKHLKNFCSKKKIHVVTQVNAVEKHFLNNQKLTFKTFWHIRISNFSRLKNWVFNFWLPPRVAIRCDKKTYSIINDIIDKYDENEIYIEYEQGAYILPMIKSDIYKTVVFHDVISQYVKRKLDRTSPLSLLRMIYTAEYLLTKRWEKSIASHIDRAIVFSEKDKRLLTEIGYDSAAIQVEAPQIDSFFYKIPRDFFDPETIIFWGSLNRFENEDAVNWFLTSIFPKILERVPQAKIIILGANPSLKIRKFASEKIWIPGYVKDPTPFFQKAAVGIAPIRYGAGVKVKVMEFMAAKIFAVCTSIAVEGIAYTDKEIAVADEESHFADAVVDRIMHYKKIR
jgi:hypothetical protein